MNTVIDSDVLMIGHVSKDRLVVNGHAASFTGGAVHYGSIPLRCIGLKTAVVKRLHSADFDLLDDMERAGVHVVPIPASQTCQMEIIYDTADQYITDDRQAGHDVATVSVAAAETPPSLLPEAFGPIRDRQVAVHPTQGGACGNG